MAGAQESVVSAISSVNLGDIQQYQNLAVVPLLKKNGGSRLEKLVLEEALQNGLKIEETAQRDNDVAVRNVSELAVNNDTGKDVLIVAGEYLVGGGQNRMVSASVYLAAGYQGKIPVRCVEHGRSRGQSRGFGYGGHTTPSVKHAKDQDETWHEVATTLYMTGTESHTQDFSQVMAQKSEDLEAIARRFAIKPSQVGFVAVIGMPDNKKYVLEFFDDPEIMKKHYDKIMNGIVAEAIPHSSARLSVDKGEITQFLEEIKSATLTPGHVASKGQEYEIITPSASGSTLICEDDTTTYMTVASSKPFMQGSNSMVLPPKRKRD
ncbi:MAG: DUF6569 family protein [Candidatus Woesearchaeota archaeon]